MSNKYLTVLQFWCHNIQVSRPEAILHTGFQSWAGQTLFPWKRGLGGEIREWTISHFGRRCSRLYWGTIPIFSICFISCTMSGRIQPLGGTVNFEKKFIFRFQISVSSSSLEGILGQIKLQRISLLGRDFTPLQYRWWKPLLSTKKSQGFCWIWDAPKKGLGGLKGCR